MAANEESDAKDFEGCLFFSICSFDLVDGGGDALEPRRRSLCAGTHRAGEVGRQFIPAIVASRHVG